MLLEEKGLEVAEVCFVVGATSKDRSRRDESIEEKQPAETTSNHVGRLLTKKREKLPDKRMSDTHDTQVHETRSLSPIQAKALAVYLRTGSLPKAGRAVNASRVTIWRWSKSAPWREAVRRHTRELVSQTSLSTRRLYRKSLRVLEASLESEDPEERRVVALAMFNKLGLAFASDETAKRVNKLSRRITDLQRALDEKAARDEATASGKLTALHTGRRTHGTAAT